MYNRLVVIGREVPEGFSGSEDRGKVKQKGRESLGRGNSVDKSPEAGRHMHI